MKRILISAIAGGIVLFLWGFVYWVVTGIPLRGMTDFKDEAAVERVLRENAPTPGYYVLPTAHTPVGLTESQHGEQRVAKISTNFFAACSVRVGGIGSLGCQLAASFGGNVVSAALMALLLLQIPGLTYRGKVTFTVGTALFASLTGVAPQSIWFGAPCNWFLINTFDLLVGWTLAGLVLARTTADARA